jgi:hypothetical protein
MMRVRAGRRTTNYSESQQRALVSPVGGQSRSVAHQLFGAEVARLTTVDNCRGDAGCKPGQPQQSVDVSGGYALLTRDIVHRQLGILTKAPLNVVCARDNSQQARIDFGLVVSAFDQHAHFAANAFEARGYPQGQQIATRTEVAEGRLASVGGVRPEPPEFRHTVLLFRRVR